MEVFCKFHGKENLGDVLINGLALFDESVFNVKRKVYFEKLISRLYREKRLPEVLALTTKLVEFYVQVYQDYLSLLEFCESYLLQENKKQKNKAELLNENDGINLGGLSESSCKAENAFQAFKLTLINCRAYNDQKQSHEPLAVQNRVPNHNNKKLLEFRDEFACVSHFWKHSIEGMHEKQYLDKIYMVLSSGEKFVRKISEVKTDFYYFKVETENNRFQVIVECYKGEETIKTAYYTKETEYLQKKKRHLKNHQKI